MRPHKIIHATVLDSPQYWRIFDYSQTLYAMQAQDETLAARSFELRLIVKLLVLRPPGVLTYHEEVIATAERLAEEIGAGTSSLAFYYTLIDKAWQKVYELIQDLPPNA